MLKIALKNAGLALLLVRRTTVFVAWLLAFACAILVLVLRYSVLPDIEHYHDDITRAASQAVGLNVEIGKIEADWHGIGPHLRLSDIRILDKHQRTTLVLQRVDTVVSWMTLIAGELRLASLEIDQPDLMVKRDVNGLISISGVELGGESGDHNFSNLLLNQSRVVVRGAHISWLDEKQSKPILIFDQVNLLLENGWGYHRFAVLATPPEELSSQLDVRGSFQGKRIEDIKSWRGELFAQLDSANLSAWKTWLPLPEALTKGQGAIRGWLGIEKGKPNQLTVDLALVDMQTRLARDLPPLDIRVLSGRIGWHDVSDGFEVVVNNLSLKLFNNFVLKPTDLFFRLSNAQVGQGSSGEIRANLLELEGLGKLIEYLPLEEKYKNKFVDYSPKGTVKNLQASWYSEAGNNLHYKIKTQFDELSLQRVGNLPGFSGLSGEVDGSESNGTLDIKSHNLKLDVPEFLPESLQFDSITAQSSWIKNSNGYELKLRNVAVANADLAGTAYGNFQTLENSPGKINLTVHLNRAFVPHAGKYIPLIALGGDARSWINRSLLAGQSNDFNLRLKGDLNDFPFVDNRKGIFKIHARAHGVAVEYEQDWPRIEDANVDLMIQGKELAVKGTSATIAGVALHNVAVAIPDIMSNDLMLKIQGEAAARNTLALAYVHASPVRGYLDGFTDDIVAHGNGRLNLQLAIPLSGTQSVKVSGNYHFMDSEVDFGNHIPLLRKVNGDLMFTESGVSTQNIVAEILGGPAKLTVKSGDGGAINIKLAGRVNLNSLGEMSSHPLLKKLSGDPAWNVEIAVKDKKSKLLLTSDLQGLKSDLPAPFTKAAKESMPLRVQMQDISMTDQSLAVRYGSLLNANLLLHKDEDGDRSARRGIINFGNMVQKADRDGLWVMGTIPLLSLDGWEEVAGAASGESTATIDIAGADLSIQKVTGYGNIVNDLHIRASSRKAMLTAHLAAKEINGMLTWQASTSQPGDNGRLVARLKNLDLGQVDGIDGKRDEPVPEPNIDAKPGTPAELPEIDLTVDQLSHKGRQLGRLELRAKQHDQDYQLDYLRLTNPDGVLNADGKWLMSADPVQTQLNLTLDISNAGNILTRAGYPNAVKDGSGKLTGHFAWPGAPGMFSTNSLSGHFDVNTGKGRFQQIDPGAGKLLSILSLQALPKRIVLDFDDVFSKGFEFDSIKGAADISKGVIVTNDLKIDGSAAKVAMTGQVDLSSETQNLRVRIVPAVGNSAALISALVATPVIGAGVYLVGKILNDPLGQIASFEYNVTGSWVDPKVEKITKNNTADVPENN